MLAWTIYLSFAGAGVEALLPKRRTGLARGFALIIALAGLAIAIAGFAAGAGHVRVVITDVLWVPSMGIHYTLAADGISRVLVLLTGLAAVAGVLFSWNIDLTACGRTSWRRLTSYWCPTGGGRWPPPPPNQSMLIWR